jgi:hypothetical protein
LEGVDFFQLICLQEKDSFSLDDSDGKAKLSLSRWGLDNPGDHVYQQSVVEHRLRCPKRRAAAHRTCLQLEAGAQAKLDTADLPVVKHPFRGNQNHQQPLYKSQPFPLHHHH